MIDDDFSPERLQLRALGHLLVQAQSFPLIPSLREGELYDRVYERHIGYERKLWLTELSDHRLIRIVENNFRVGDRVGMPSIDVCLTPAGTYYSVARTHVFGTNARTPTDDFPDVIVDTPWAIHSYFSPAEKDMAPTADSFVRFDHNEASLAEAIEAISAVAQALAADNEIGSAQPSVRDEKLTELKAIRELLEKREGWVTRLISLAGMTLCYLATQFADRPVGYLAEQAWQSIQTIIGLR